MSPPQSTENTQTKNQTDTLWGIEQVPAKAWSEAPKFNAVDYDDVDGLAKILEYHGIDTIISTLNLENQAGCQAQLNLIAAAEKSRATRRIIPSEFVANIDEKYISPRCGDSHD